MNRRLPIFILVFLIVCAAGLGYTYSITPTYLATAKIQVDPGTNPEEVQDSTAFVANEAQALTSNEMLETMLAALNAKNPTSSSFASVPRLREVLSAAPSPGTNVIELQARGSEPQVLAELLDVWAAAYLNSRTARRTVDRGADVDEARRAVQSIENRVAGRRRQLDEFRGRHSIVSPEREENEVAAQMRSLTGAVNDARSKAVDAESRLSTAKASMAEGKPVYRPQDKVIIAQLEQRLLDLREKLTQFERNFTPDYLAMEPAVKTLYSNVKQLEQKIEETKRGSQQSMLNEAAQDFATGQKNVARLEAQISESRKDALQFTSRFAQHNAQTTELAQLEAELVKAKERVALLDRKERKREPSYQLLGRPAVPDKPVHPDYPLYAGYSIGGALAAALLAVALVEFLSPRRKPEALPYPQPIIQIAYPSLPGGPNAQQGRLIGEAAALSFHASPAALAAPVLELTVPEVYGLWGAATADGRLVVAALFSGLTLPELASLEWDDVDLEGGCLNVREPGSRVQQLATPLTEELQARGPSRAGVEAVATTSGGATLSLADLEGLVAAAAHDAGLEHAEAVDAETLRNTYVSFLVRQGVRLADLEQVVGPVPPALFLHYRSLSPRGAGVPLTAVNRVFPAFAIA